MKNNSTVAMPRKRNVSAKKLTIGMDLGDRFSYYCVLDEAGEVLIEQKLPTTKTAMQQAFGRIPCSRVALETGAQELREERAPTVHQQRRRPLSANAAGARSAVHSGAVWTGQRSTALGTEARRTGRQERQETSRRCRGTEVGRTAAQVMGERRSL
jgi:hypothetical protein